MFVPTSNLHIELQLFLMSVQWLRCRTVTPKSATWSLYSQIPVVWSDRLLAADARPKRAACSEGIKKVSV